MGATDKPKVALPAGASGGDTLEIRNGGVVKVFAAGSGGGAIHASGGQASHIANRTAATATGGASATALNSTVASLASGVNSILTALRGIGVLATS